jgi:hypothetical protein
MKRRSQQKANRKYKKADESGDKVMPARSLNSHMAMSSSLDGIFISPRTPVARPFRPPQNGNPDSEEVELSLLGEAERRQAAVGLDEDDEVDYNSKRPISSKDKRAMILLCVLCKCFLLIKRSYCPTFLSVDLIQGVPVSRSRITRIMATEIISEARVGFGYVPACHC